MTSARPRSHHGKQAGRVGPSPFRPSCRRAESHRPRSRIGSRGPVIDTAGKQAGRRRSSSRPPVSHRSRPPVSPRSRPPASTPSHPPHRLIGSSASFLMSGSGALSSTRRGKQAGGSRFVRPPRPRLDPSCRSRGSPSARHQLTERESKTPRSPCRGTGRKASL